MTDNLATTERSGPRTGRPNASSSRDAIAEACYDIQPIDAFDWLAAAEPNSVHAVVTDPPYGLIEYTPQQLEKRDRGRGGVWRIPPSFDGCQRSPLPRFTVLTPDDKDRLQQFFHRFAQ